MEEEGGGGLKSVSALLASNLVAASPSGPGVSSPASMTRVIAVQAAVLFCFFFSFFFLILSPSGNDLLGLVYFGPQISLCHILCGVAYTVRVRLEWAVMMQ